MIDYKNKAEVCNLIKTYLEGTNQYSKRLTKFNLYIDAIYFKSFRKVKMCAGTFTKYNKRFLSNKDKGVLPLNYILRDLGLKHCTNCNFIQKVENFYINKTQNSGYSCWCKDCDAAYKTSNNTDYCNNTSKYRSAKISRTPSWANINKIKEIYNKCPKGFHVDHIIPLQGKLVSGLHVEYNLQYLTPSENTSKGNRF